MQSKINQYLTGELSLESLIHFCDKNLYTKEEIKNGGIVYTPKYIADLIIKKVDPDLKESVFEPSVGHGIFIFSLLEYIQKKYSLSALELKEYFLGNVFACDIQPRNISELKLLISAFFKKQDVCLPEGEINNLFVGDTLQTTDCYDCIVGNPPYVRVQNIDAEYLSMLREKYKSCEKGNIDLYYPFMEHAYQHSKRCSFIVPNSWIYNSGARNLRNIIKKDLVEIIDFKERMVFETVSTYTSIFFINKTAFGNVLQYSEDIDGEAVSIEKELLDERHWDFRSKGKPSITLGFASFKTPIATLRDKIYITDEVDSSDMCNFYKISKCRNADELLLQKQKIVFPYKFDPAAKKHVIKSEEELDTFTLGYLKTKRAELEKRDKGNTSRYESWYAYGRKQGLNLYDQDNLVVIIPGMIPPKYRFFSIPISSLGEHFLFGSGFLIEIRACDKDNLLAFLNSNRVREHIEKIGKVWKGKSKDSSYYSINMRQLKEMVLVACGDDL